MNVHAVQSELKEIQSLRNLFLQETNFQVRYNAYHERGWTDSYTLWDGPLLIGYGSVKGKENTTDRDTIFEFYLVPTYRNRSNECFAELLDVSKASWITCQSNDTLLTALLFQFGQDVNADVVLFQDHISPGLQPEQIIFRKRHKDDQIFEHQSEPVGEYVLEWKGEVVATGGFLLHYNFPFADLYMEVRDTARRKGYGSFLIQELKNQCNLAGRVPAARCDIGNTASRATLIKGGMQVAGFMLMGRIKAK